MKRWRLYVLAVIAGALFAVVCAAEELPSPGDVSRHDYCEAWANNAMYGASQQIRGAKPSFRFVNDFHAMLEMIEHELGGDYLYVIANDEYQPEHYFFIMKSILAGYMLMQNHRVSHPEPQDPIMWQKRIFGACMESSES